MLADHINFSEFNMKLILDQQLVLLNLSEQSEPTALEWR